MIDAAVSQTARDREGKRPRSRRLQPSLSFAGFLRTQKRSEGGAEETGFLCASKRVAVQAWRGEGRGASSPSGAKRRAKAAVCTQNLVTLS
jgi:hypothetical protein